MIDYRSDTVTRPTPAMKDAMFSAPVGDDVFRDDPTVNHLETMAAEKFGKQAALFCPSGTMTNQIAIKVHTQPGDDVICDKLSHIYNYEGGGIAFNSGCSVRLLEGDRGRFTAEQVEAAIQPDDPHFPVSRLVSVENTCNKGGGVIWSQDDINAIGRVCQQAGLRYHLDGARLFNALVETRVSPAEFCKPFDSISVCLSKGLGCPVGSLLIGDEAFVKQARRVRKVLGGGMRQAGMLAAAGIFALEHHVERLREDHLRARSLAEVLRGCKWVEQVMPVETNIIVAVLQEGFSEKEMVKKIEAKGVRTVGFGAGKIRFVTHHDVDDSAIQKTMEILKKL